jgi:alpha-mannosidase
MLLGLSSTKAWRANELVEMVPSGPASKPWPPGGKKYRLDLIANAHIDAAWLWPWSEAMAVVLSTFRSALDRMKSTPGFTFTASSAQFYEWAAESDPEMLQEIRQRIEEGRWGLVGGWWVEPDVNIPNGESLARQGLYGQRLFQRLFGRGAKVAYNPDSFGHTGTLPQILKLQEMEEYVFMRPQEQEKHLPADVFWWEGPDGTRVLTYRIPFSYGEAGGLEGRVHQMLDLHEPVNELMVFFGAGDHGGGATDQNIRSIQEILASSGAPEAIYSTPERYFSAIRRLADLDLPVVQGDLQYHSVGCYTAESGIKKDNRTTEMALATAEKTASLGWVCWGFLYPHAELTSAWERVLFLQFHDSLAGTALPEHYVVARDAYGYARTVADQVISLSLEKLAEEVPSEDPQSEYLLVFNPHAWSAHLGVEYDLDWNPAAVSELVDDQGQSVVHQWVQASTVVGEGRKKLVFRAALPAFGYRQFRLRKGSAAQARPAGVRASSELLENDHLRVTFSPDGTIGVLDKDVGQEVFEGPIGGARAIVLDDPSDTWSHDVRAYAKEMGAFRGAACRVLENGPLRGRVRVRTHYGASALETDWILYAGDRTLEARCSLDWHEHLKMLKFSFPVRVQEPRSVYEIAFGFIERKADGHENPGQRWVDLTGRRAGQEYGLGIINDAKYGYSVLNNDLRISITRSAVFAQHRPAGLTPNGEYIWQDQGMQTFRMLLVPHSGSWQAARLMRWAEEFTAPVPALYQGSHGGSRPQSASFLSVDVSNVVMSALKKAEEGEELVLRCYETDGRPTTATLELGLVHRRWTGSFRPLEIKTLRVPLTGGAIREVNLLEE